MKNGSTMRVATRFMLHKTHFLGPVKPANHAGSSRFVEQISIQYAPCRKIAGSKHAWKLTNEGIFMVEKAKEQDGTHFE